MSRLASAVAVYEDDRDWFEVQLSQERWAKLDLADLRLVVGHLWRFSKGYAIRGQRDQRIPMHRVILGLPPGHVPQVDHKNHDKLDNRRSNLRPATNGQNQANRRKTRGTSRYKGVSWDPINQKWQVTIQVDGRSRNLGRFSSEIEAAMAYNRAARKEFGEYALLNDVPVRILRRKAS